jgi:hypothetical protein
MRCDRKPTRGDSPSSSSCYMGVNLGLTGEGLHSYGAG